MATNIKNSLTIKQTKELQNALTSLGYSIGKAGADGILGKNTQKAIDSAYKDLGLKTWQGGGISQAGYDRIMLMANRVSGGTPATSTPTNNLVWTPTGGNPNDTAAIGKAEAFLTGGTYDPNNYSYNVDNWAGSQGLKAQIYGNNKEYKSLGMTANDMGRINAYAALYDQAERDKYAAVKNEIERKNVQFEELSDKFNQISDIQNLYQQGLAEQQRMYEEQKAAREAEIANTVNSIRGNEDIINRNYADAQKEAYISSMLEKKDMNDYLAALGYTGGLTESTAAQIGANYQNNRANAVEERDAALRQNERLAAEAQISGNSDLAAMAASATSDYINALKEQAGMTFQINQSQLAQQNADREFEFSKLQADRNYQMSLDALKKDEQRYKESQKLSLAENDMQSFLNTYQGKYQKKATYEKWISNLEKMKDPYGFNAQKIAHLRQYITQTFLKKAPVIYAGGSTGGTASGNGQTAIAEATQDQTERYTTLRTAILRDSMNYGLADTERELGKRISDVEKIYKAGGITEKQAKSLLYDIQRGATRREEIAKTEKGGTQKKKAGSSGAHM